MKDKIIEETEKVFLKYNEKNIISIAKIDKKQYDKILLKILLMIEKKLGKQF